MEETATTRLAQVIRSKRSALGLTQESFADSIEMHRAYYGRVERGSMNVTLLTLSRIAKGLGTSCADLLTEAKL